MSTIFLKKASDVKVSDVKRKLDSKVHDQKNGPLDRQRVRLTVDFNCVKIFFPDICAFENFKKNHKSSLVSYAISGISGKT